jgi:hypothetical protein
LTNRNITKYFLMEKETSRHVKSDLCFFYFYSLDKSAKTIKSWPRLYDYPDDEIPLLSKKMCKRFFVNSMQEFKRSILFPKLFSHFAIADNWSISLGRIDQHEKYSIFPWDKKKQVQYLQSVFCFFATDSLDKGAETTNCYYQPKPWAPVSIYR